MTTFEELNQLFKCKVCLGYTPRDLIFCVWCENTKIPPEEQRGKVKDNTPEHMKDPTIRYLPKLKK